MTFFVNPISVFIGWAVIALSLFLIVSGIAQWIRNTLYVRKKRRELRGRFDKPPTAKCFCAECARWIEQSKASENDNASGYCPLIDRYTADSWFCWDAEKKSRAEILRRKGEK